MRINRIEPSILHVPATRRQIAADVQRCLDDGFRGVKIEIGRPDISDDSRRIGGITPWCRQPIRLTRTGCRSWRTWAT